jgi:hypothetical protein
LYLSQNVKAGKIFGLDLLLLLLEQTTQQMHFAVQNWFCGLHMTFIHKKCLGMSIVFPYLKRYLSLNFPGICF